MRSLTIIGGTGFFGKSFIENFKLGKLQKYKIKKIYVISRGKLKINQHKFKNIEYIIADVKNLKLLPVSDYYIFAATSSNKENYEKNIRKEIDNITLGIENFLKTVISQKLFYSKFLFYSSGAVYGKNCSKKKIKENHKILDKNLKKLNKEKKLYALSKIKAEKLIMKVSKKFKLNFSIARCFAFYGNNLPIEGHFFLSKIINSIKNKAIINLNSSNLDNIYRSFMHTDDLIEWSMKIIEKSNPSTPIYNIGSDKYFSLMQFLNFLKKKRYELKFQIENQKNDKTKTDFYIPDISKAKKLHLKIKKDITKNFFKQICNLADYNKSLKI